MRGCQLRWHLYGPYVCMPPVHSCTPCTSMYSPIHHYASIPLLHLYVLPIPYVPHMLLELGGSVHPICLGVFWGASVHLLGILVSVKTSICLSAHNSHTSSSPSLLATSLLDWMPMDVWYASCCCWFLCSFHYVSSFYYHSYDYYFSSDCCFFWCVISSLCMGLSATSGQNDVVLLSPLILKHSRGVTGLATVLQQQPASQMPLQVNANYAMSPP